MSIPFNTPSSSYFNTSPSMVSIDDQENIYTNHEKSLEEYFYTCKNVFDILQSIVVLKSNGAGAILHKLCNLLLQASLC